MQVVSLARKDELGRQVQFATITFDGLQIEVPGSGGSVKIPVRNGEIVAPTHLCKPPGAVSEKAIGAIEQELRLGVACGRVGDMEWSF